MDNLKSFIEKAHNLSLVDENESPNGNTIYHIYSDGEITYQKGGWAYLQRSEFSDSCIFLKKNYHDLFPMKGRYSYAVVTRDDAYKIQQMMIEVDKL
jgi:hypothetical protein